VTRNDATIIIGSDHAGFKLKEFVKSELARRKIPFVDAGAHKLESGDDYPVYAARVAQAISSGGNSRGILLCGTGIGASIVANRYRGVRAALCTSAGMAKASREHNNANVLVLGGRITSKETAAAILGAWLSSAFEGGRHARRVEMIDKDEK
jgi:RpiB/LacA/LacB family sugar-phosphate isomerase